MTDPQKYIIAWTLTGLLIIGLPFWLRQLRTAMMARPAALPPEEGDSGSLQAENQALKAHVHTLEGRLQVLERIATDAPARLTAEIENLR
jgi:hypothetical protein